MLSPVSVSTSSPSGVARRRTRPVRASRSSTRPDRKKTASRPSRTPPAPAVPVATVAPPAPPTALASDSGASRGGSRPATGAGPPTAVKVNGSVGSTDQRWAPVARSSARSLGGSAVPA